VNTPNRVSASLAYLLLIIGWLYVFLFRKEDKLAMYHTKQSMMLIIVAIGASLIWAIAGWLVSLIPFVGFIVAVAIFALVITVYIVLLIGWIVGMVYALQAKIKPIPVVGRWAEQLFGT
jgi:uncharacterized membrane protein